MKGQNDHNVHVYAQAMFALAQEQDLVDTVLSEFELLRQMQQRMPSFKTFLEIPFFGTEERAKTMDAILRDRVSSIFLNFVKLLLAKRHFRLFPRIHGLYLRFADEHAGRVRASAITALPVPQEKLQEIASVLPGTLGRKVLIDNVVKPEILGGLVVQIEDLWIDASLQRQIEKLRRQLCARGSDELRRRVRG